MRGGRQRGRGRQGNGDRGSGGDSGGLPSPRLSESPPIRVPAYPSPRLPEAAARARCGPPPPGEEGRAAHMQAARMQARRGGGEDPDGASAATRGAGQAARACRDRAAAAGRVGAACGGDLGPAGLAAAADSGDRQRAAGVGTLQTHTPCSSAPGRELGLATATRLSQSLRVRFQLATLAVYTPPACRPSPPGPWQPGRAPAFRTRRDSDGNQEFGLYLSHAGLQRLGAARDAGWRVPAGVSKGRQGKRCEENRAG